MFHVGGDQFPKNQVRTRYGAPLSRRRLYLLLIRESALTDEASQMELMDFIQEKLKAMHIEVSKTPWILGCFFQQMIEEQANMNVTINVMYAFTSSIAAAGKERLAPAEEGPSCQEGHGQALPTWAELQASWLRTPSKCGLTHAARF